MPLPLSVLAALAMSFALALIAVPVVRRLAHTGGHYERPASDRWHRRLVPKLGGVALAGALIPVAWHFADTAGLRILIVAAALLSALGVFDDLRPLRLVVKLAGQLLIAGLFVSVAPSIDLTGHPIVDGVLALLWFVGITNAFNLLDNIDGLAAGIAAIAAVFFATALLLSGSPPLMGLVPAVAATAGVSLAFLLYNWHPASIFMGDGGSYLLGSTLAGTTILAAPHVGGEAGLGVAIAVVLLLVPCADTTLVVLTRQISGCSVFQGGLDHLSHRMVAIGASERRAVLVLYGIAGAGGLVVLGLQHFPARVGWVLAALYGVAVAAVGAYLGHVEISRESEEQTTSAARPLPLDLTSHYPAYEVLFDAALIAFAYHLGLLTRFWEQENLPFFLSHLLEILPLVVILHLAGLWAAGKYRHRPRTTHLADVVAILRGAAIGSAATIVVVLYLTGFQDYSRQAFAVAGLLIVLFLTGGHVTLRSFDNFLRARRSRRIPPA